MDKKGGFCPECKTEYVECLEQFFNDDGTMEIIMQCQECNKEWAELYKFVDYIEEEEDQYE